MFENITLVGTDDMGNKGVAHLLVPIAHSEVIRSFSYNPKTLRTDQTARFSVQTNCEDCLFQFFYENTLIPDYFVVLTDEIASNIIGKNFFL